MGAERPLVIFHLARADGSSVFLHPMDDTQQMIELLERRHVEGGYGNEPALSALHEFRDELYACLDAAVARWALERSFIPRFVSAAATFVVGYFLFSLLLRAVVPVVIHLAAAVLVAVGAYQYLARRTLAAESTANKREQLREHLDRIVFSEHGFVFRLEERLHRYEAREPEAIVDEILARRGELVHDHEYELAEQFAELLQNRFNTAGYRRRARKLVRMATEATGDGGPLGRELSRRELAALKQWAARQAVDMPLFGLLVAVRAELRQFNRSPA